MLAHWFRFIDDGKTTGHIGLAVARNRKELFWEIDQYGDPFCVELMKVESGSYCIKEKLTGYINKSLELSDYTPRANDEINDNRKWRKPNWNLEEVYKVDDKNDI